MNITIPDDYQNAVKSLDCYKLLQDHNVTVYNDTVKSIDELAERFKDAEAIVLIRERTKVTDELLSKLPKLKLISQIGKVSKHLDVNACTKHKVAVAEGVGSPIATAELTWNLIMSAWRQLPQAIEGMKKGLWQTNMGRALNGQTIGIWGYGRIGKRIASYAKAFGMEVVIWGSENSRENAVKDGFSVADTKEEFISSVDILTLHLRLSGDTRYIVKESDLALMKPDALLVNTSRAELIEPGALVNALKSGRPGFAALDVYENEPVLDKDYPLLQMPNVICTPHLGYVERNGYEFYFSQAFENILAFSKGTPVNIANPEVLKA
ncbi:MAG: D-2-hydroxyacid dehydrogenase family protein [Bacteroidales bacterium]|nr:D-2-hydroxyacid dehydrogenase family protein [Bacteroidales bacterium]